MAAEAPDLKSGNVGSSRRQVRPRKAPPSRDAEAAPTHTEGDPPYAAGSNASTAPVGPADARPLPPEPGWVVFDPELERLCRIGAQVGGSQAAPISYTALMIAYLWAEDPVSNWFRNFVGSNKSIDKAGIFKSKAIKDRDR
ncbi:MAG: hypothetical protein OEY03_14350, partial [Rhizobacter sp.]|nr:hypothetical protein [Rhizobacter sp.]